MEGPSRSHNACFRHAGALLLLMAFSSVVWLSEAAKTSKKEVPPKPEISRLSYEATLLRDMLKMLADMESDIGVPVNLLLPHIKTMQSRDESGELADKSIVLTENGQVVGGFSGYIVLPSGTANFNEFVMSPEVVDKRRATETLVRKMLESVDEGGVKELSVTTDPEDTILTEVMGNFGFFLGGHQPKEDKPMGFYTWKINMPYMGDFVKHRSAVNESAGEPNLAAVIGLAGKELGKTFLLRFANAAISLHVKKFRHVDPRIALQLMTKSEREMADEAYVVDYKKAQAVEQRRAVTFVRERVLESATAMEHTPVDITDPNTTSYIMSTQTDFSIIGVAAGHLSEDKSEFTVDFLGAMGPVEDYVKASLLAEVLADAKSKGAKKVVLKEVSVDDVAAVSAAVELQFKIERKSENTFSMVADCTKQVKNLDAIVLTRKLECQYRGWTKFVDSRTSPGGPMAEIKEVVEAVMDGSRSLINSQTRAVFVHVAAIVALVFVGMVARQIGKAKRRAALARRVRQMTLVGEEEVHARQQPVYVPAGVSANMRMATPGRGH